MAKYDALRDRLVRSVGGVEMSFADVADLVGGLPPSAYEHRAWWANNLDHVHAESWLPPAIGSSP
jgi:hypothetical protein